MSGSLPDKIIGSFDDWRINLNKLEYLPLMLDRDFIIAMKKAMDICKDRMKEIDPKAYDKKKEKQLKDQTKLAFGGK